MQDIWLSKYNDGYFTDNFLLIVLRRQHIDGIDRLTTATEFCNEPLKI